MTGLTQQTIDLVKAAQKDDVSKAFTQPSTATTGLQQYNLEAPAKNLFPLLTPLRNNIARVTGGYAIQANWKAITGINTTNVRAGVSEGNRGGVISHTLAEYLAAFRGYGLEDYTTFEAQFAGEGFDDIRARSISQLLQAMMIREELMDLGGNTSVALGTTGTPTLVASASGGTLATQTLSVIVVALSHAAYLDLVGVNNGAINQSLTVSSAIVPAQITRTNADGSSDTFGGGSAQKSAAATVSVTGATGSVAASCAVKNGAAGYAWFWGAAGSEVLGAVSSINSVSITATATGTQTAASLPSQDSSTSALEYDGLLYQAYKSGSGAIISSQATGVAGTGTPLTSDGAGGISEFESIFVQLYNKYRVSPTKIYMSSQELVNSTRKIVGNAGAPLLRTVVDATDPTKIVAGTTIGSYLNKVTGAVIPIVIHPNMPAGTIFFDCEMVPYPLSGVPILRRKLLRRDYYQTDWALRTRKWEYGVYADGVLQHYAPFSLAILTNIGNG